MSDNKDDKKFRLHLLRVHNVMGVGPEMEIKPGVLTLLEGKNGVGKTTIVEALKAAFGKGHSARLLREGETEGEVVVLLDDGRGAPYLRVSAQITKDQTKRVIGYPGEKALQRPAEVLSSMSNPFTLFPTEFLTMKKTDRLELFLSAIPLRIGKEDVADILNLVDKPDSVDLSQHALKVIETLDVMLREKRAKLNASVLSERKTAMTMREALPNEEEAGVSPNRIASLKAEMSDEAFAYDKTRQQKMRERDLRIAAARLVFDQETQSANDDYNSTMKDVAEEHNETMVALQSDLTRIQEIFNQSERSVSARRMIESLCATADEDEAKSGRLTKAIHEQLSELRSALLEKVPIKGVSIKDQDILVRTPDGVDVSFDSVNTAERIRVVCDLALLNAGPLPIICLDGAEALDEEHLVALRNTLAKRGAQCVASRVTQDDELRVNRP